MYTHWEIPSLGQKKAICTILGNEFQIVAKQGQRFFFRGAGGVYEFYCSREDLQ